MPDLESANHLLRLGDINDKGNPALRRGRKATGLRFLRAATDDSPKDPRSLGAILEREENPQERFTGCAPSIPPSGLKQKPRFP